MDNWIFKYHEAIQKKEVIVGVWVRLCFEILTTGLLNGEWEFNEKKANKAIKFIEFRGAERPFTPGIVAKGYCVRHIWRYGQNNRV